MNLALIKVYPKEVLLNIVNRAEKKSQIVNGIKVVSYGTLKKVIGTSMFPEHKIIKIPKQERKIVINQLEKNKFITVINKVKVTFKDNDPFK